MRNPLKLAGVAGAALLAMGLSTAQAAYPEKPITMIVCFPAGGGTDIGARLFVPYMEKNMPAGSSFVVVNRGGAGGAIGMTEISQAAPDGYTIGWMNVPNIMMKPHERETAYSVNTLEPIANAVYDVAVITALPNSKYKTLADVVAEAKKRPGEITVSSAGVGSNTHLDVINLERAAGIKLNHVPFEGGAQSRNALLGGHTELFATALGDSARFAEAGELRILGIMATERNAIAPDVPTYAEQGWPATGGSARGLVGPKGMPAESVKVLADALEKAMKDPELIAKAKELGLPLHFMGTKAYGEYLQASDKVIAEIWKTSPWK